MRPEATHAGLGPLASRCAHAARRALSALAAHRRVRSALLVLTGPGARERLRLGWATARHHPDVVLAAVLVVGVLVMILHWS